MENHPIAECYPPLPDREFQELKEHIRLHGLQIPIVLFEGKILCGIHRERVCKELGIEAVYISPDIADPVAYAIGDNETRRHLNQSQKAVIAESLANLKWGSNRYQEKKSLCDKDSNIPRSKRSEVAKKTGASLATMDRVRIAKREGGQHFVEAIKNAKVSADEAYNISRLPKEEHEAALQAAVERKPNRETVTPSGRKSRKTAGRRKIASVKLQWTPEEAARDEACLAIINAPSTYPQDVVISQNTNPCETGLRLAISWLRENESRIASFKRPECDNMLLRTNRIQGYHVNYHGFPRPDGKLDPRLLDWAQDLWKRRERQQTRLELAAKLHPPRPHRRTVSENGGKDRPFEDRFKTFWMLVEDGLGLFRRRECPDLIRAFRNEVKQFFSISDENRGAADVADAQKNGDSQDQQVV